MQYIILMNNKYINSFKDYSKAIEEKERLEKLFPKQKNNIIIDIEYI